MSFNSYLKPTGTICQQTLTAFDGTTGIKTVAIGNAQQPFYSSTSKIIGVSGGLDDTLYSVTVDTITQAAIAASTGLITIASADAADTSVLTVYWVNSVYPGLLPC